MRSDTVLSRSVVGLGVTDNTSSTVGKIRDVVFEGGKLVGYVVFLLQPRRRCACSSWIGSSGSLPPSTCSPVIHSAEPAPRPKY